VIIAIDELLAKWAGEGRLSNSRQTHLLPSMWGLLTWITQHLLTPEKESA
jgi:hypothetical protein